MDSNKSWALPTLNCLSVTYSQSVNPRNRDCGTPEKSIHYKYLLTIYLPWGCDLQNKYMPENKDYWGVERKKMNRGCSIRKGFKEVEFEFFNFLEEMERWKEKERLSKKERYEQIYLLSSLGASLLLETRLFSPFWAAGSMSSSSLSFHTLLPSIEREVFPKEVPPCPEPRVVFLPCPLFQLSGFPLHN